MNKTFPLTVSIFSGFALFLSSCSSTDTISRSGGQQPSMSQVTSNRSLPAPVSAEVAAQASSLPKDKYGSPTYSVGERHRLVRTTAYSHMENEPGAPGRKTAIGTTLAYGAVRSAAADWSVYPVGTRFKIKGLPYTYVVDDFGSALVGTNTIDIFHPTLGLMRKWGTRKAEITITHWGSAERTLAILKKRTRHSHCRRMYYASLAKYQAGNVAQN